MNVIERRPKDSRKRSARKKKSQQQQRHKGDVRGLGKKTRRTAAPIHSHHALRERGGAKGEKVGEKSRQGFTDNGELLPKKKATKETNESST